MSANWMMQASIGWILLAAAGGVAADAGGEDLQFHGFISQGFVLSEGNNVNGTSTDSSGSFKYQEFGVNGSWRPRGDTLVAAQLASVRAGEATDEYLILEYGLVDYTPWQAESGRAGLRAGKLKLNDGFYNDSRDAVFTRPSILLPQGIYLDTSGGRQFGYFSVYGYAAYADFYAGDHAIYLEAGAYGDQSLGETADIAILRADAQGTFRIDQGALIRIADDYAGGRARAALTVAGAKLDYNPAPSDTTFTQPGQLHFDQYILSLQYNWPRFSLTGEYVWRDFHLDELIGSPGLRFLGVSTKTDIDPTGAYLQGTYRMSPKWSAFLRYDEQIRDHGDRDGREQAARSAAVSARAAAFGQNIPAQPRHYYFAHDWTAGTRYDLMSNLALWAEFHYVDGVAWVNPLDNPDFDEGTAERYWNLFTVMLGYRF